MRIESLTCNNCGAPLEVPEGANFIRCNHCDRQLAVRRDSSVTYTELVQQVAERTERLTDQVVQLSYQNELNSIDQAWERERESLLITDKRGNRREPSYVGAAIGGVLLSGFGLFFTAAAGPLGLLLIVAGLFVGLFGWFKAAEFERARRRYRRRRSQVSVDDIRQRVLADSGNPDASEFPGLPS